MVEGIVLCFLGWLGVVLFERDYGRAELGWTKGTEKIRSGSGSES